MWPFKKSSVAKTETRNQSGYTSQMMFAREAGFTGQSGIGELTATVQSCVSLWEGGLSLADVEGTELLTPAVLALAARSLALRGEAVFLIHDEGLLPCVDWDMTTRFSRPVAYRVSVPDIGGGTSQMALAAEVIHLRIGCEMNMPFFGVPPLRRASLTAGLLQTLEEALSEVYSSAPLGSSVIPFPEAPNTDMDDLARGFRGMRGKVLVRESVNVTAAGGPAPQSDLKPADVTPDLSKAMTKENLAAAKAGIEMVFGVLPGLGNSGTTGPLVREAQRHLAQWALMPLATMIGQEATEKLGSPVKLDVMRPLQAYDAGGRARTVTAIVQALAMAKEAGVDPGEALKLVDWE